MPDQIAFHIQEEIIKRASVKQLLQLRSVSKAWKSLIDSSEFIAAHSLRHNSPHHLLVKYQDPVESEEKYVCLVDDDTFPQQRFVPTLPISIQRLNLPLILGSSHGLLCFYDNYPNLRSAMAVLWNPSIRKSIDVAVPNEMHMGHESVVGFGVCPSTNDPKIIKITQFCWWYKKQSELDTPWKVKVYMMSSGKWKSLSSNLPTKSFRVTWPQVVIHRFIYWCGLHKVAINGRLRTRNVIMSFDMSNEGFRVIELPDSLACHMNTQLCVSKLRESLVMLEYTNIKNMVCGVWMMEHGGGNSFTKVFAIKASHGTILTRGFRMSCKPILVVKYDLFGSGRLVEYDPNSEHFNDLEICGTGDSFFVNSYTETLLLLGRSN